MQMKCWFCPWFGNEKEFFLNIGSTSVLGQDYEQNGVDKKRSRFRLNTLGGRKVGELYGGRKAEIGRSLKSRECRSGEIENQQRVRKTA